MAPKMGEGGQIWLKCITGDLIMMIRDKNNIFERVENFHADLAWNYPLALFFSLTIKSPVLSGSADNIIGSNIPRAGAHQQGRHLQGTEAQHQSDRGQTGGDLKGSQGPQPTRLGRAGGGEEKSGQ